MRNDCLSLALASFMVRKWWYQKAFVYICSYVIGFFDETSRFIATDCTFLLLFGLDLPFSTIALLNVSKR